MENLELGNTLTEIRTHGIHQHMCSNRRKILTAKKHDMKSWTRGNKKGGTLQDERTRRKEVWYGTESLFKV